MADLEAEAEAEADRKAEVEADQPVEAEDQLQLFNSGRRQVVTRIGLERENRSQKQDAPGVHMTRREPTRYFLNALYKFKPDK
ncbi:hypothetical protein D3C85_1574490 [compost metagenome]